MTRTETNASQTIPPDVVFEILTRLPVKSLLRLRCVSKLWNSTLFHDPCFVKARTRFSTAFIFAFPEGIPYNQKLTVDNVKHYYKDVGETDIFAVSGKPSQSLNGLVCLDKGSIHSLRVVNPSTRKFITLPPIPTFPCDLDSTLTRTNHFGYDPINDQYKVLSELKDSRNHPCMKEKYVFVTGGKSWRRLPDDGDDLRYFCSDGQFCGCVNGILYYSALKLNMGDWDYNIIIVFNVRLETFSSILPPFTLPIRGCNMMQFDGKLAITACNNLIDKNYISMWYLDDPIKPNWIHKRIVFPSFTSNIADPDPDHCQYQLFYIAGSLQDGEIIVVVNNLNSCLCYLNLKLASVVKIVEMRCLKDNNLLNVSDYSKIIVTTHLESLNSLPELSTFSYE